MAKIGLEVNEKKWRRDDKAPTAQETARTLNHDRDAFAPAPPRFYDMRATVATVDNPNGRGASSRSRRRERRRRVQWRVFRARRRRWPPPAATRGCLVRANADARTCGAELPRRTSVGDALRWRRSNDEAAARARSRLNPLKGARVPKLVALHEAAAAKLAQQAEARARSRERLLRAVRAHFDGPKRGSEHETAVVEGAVIDVARKRTRTMARARFRRARRSRRRRAPGWWSQACEPTTGRAKAREPSVWDMWYR